MDALIGKSASTSRLSCLIDVHQILRLLYQKGQRMTSFLATTASRHLFTRLPLVCAREWRQTLW